MKTKKGSRRITIMFIALIVIVSTVTPGVAENTITLAYNGDPKVLAPWKFVHLVSDEMFRRLNIELKYEVLPSKRAGVEANEGRMDGDNARIYGYNKDFPNLLRVEGVIYTMVMAGYATDPTIHLDGWDSLRGTKYKVEYQHGTKFLEVNLSKVVLPENLSTIIRRRQALDKLILGRTDVYIEVRGLVVSFLNQEEFKKAGIREVGVMDTAQLYLYLHKKHSALIPDLEEVLTQIKSEGLYNEYWQQAFGKTD